MDAICFPDYEPFEFDHTNWYVAMYKDTVIGYCGWRYVNNSVGELCRSGVLPDWRGDGLQSKMISYRENVMKSKGIIISVTTTYQNNFVSMNNLIKAGYLTCASEDWPNVDGLKNGSVYWKKKL